MNRIKVDNQDMIIVLPHGLQGHNIIHQQSPSGAACKEDDVHCSWVVFDVTVFVSSRQFWWS